MKKILILGPGCPNCTKLYDRAETAARELDLDSTPEKITDIEQITSYGVMMTPALVIGDEVKFSGKVPSVEELKKLFAMNLED